MHNVGGQWQPGLPLTSYKAFNFQLHKKLINAEARLSNALPCSTTGFLQSSRLTLCLHMALGGRNNRMES
jgi:hypothetical protein